MAKKKLCEKADLATSFYFNTVLIVYESIYDTE